VYRRLQDERSFIKTLPIRARIFDVCQEHLTGFDMILISTVEQPDPSFETTK
jgi:hypothetical protein